MERALAATFAQNQPAHGETVPQHCYRCRLYGSGHSAPSCPSGTTRKTLLIEASTIGEGASGRNSGYLSINPGEPSANAAEFADDWANRQMAIVQAGFDLLRSQVQAHAIDCDWDDTPLAVTAAATPAVEKIARATRRTSLKWGLNPENTVRTRCRN
ncbi:FAD-dependent oxidoreductase [Brucella sp. BE17]|uniref:FAD-dependent oxidoreductase n=1 Tax=Brucella sp. BE17 TaxID=3142977 RepID=UPI0031BA69D4